MAYASFLDQYREIGIAFRHRGVSLMNCTEGGARIPEVEHRTFRSFAEEFATEVLDARGKILEIHDAAPRFGLEDFERALGEARTALRKIRVEAVKGLRFADKHRDKLLSARSDQQRLDVLKGMARHEKRVRKHLERTPWLDSRVQPEIYNAIAAVRRTERKKPSDEQLAEETCFLFTATRNGVERAEKWFEAFETSFAAQQEGTGRSDQKRSPTAPSFVVPPS